MANTPLRHAPKAAPRSEGADPFTHLAEVLRTLFAAKLPDPKADDPADDMADDADEDEIDAAPPQRMALDGPGPFSALPTKGMRRISISILLPMKKSSRPK